MHLSLLRLQGEANWKILSYLYLYIYTNFIQIEKYIFIELQSNIHLQNKYFYVTRIFDAYIYVLIYIHFYHTF